MFVYTDNKEFAAEIIAESACWKPISITSTDENIRQLATAIFPGRKLYYGEIALESDVALSEFNCLFMVERSVRSHYDLLIDLCREGIEPPHGLLCLTGSGKKLHGFKNRPWEALKGNIHLVVYFRPECEIKNFGSGFMALTAVSVVQAIETVAELKGRAAIKWVNDILIDQAKVCGVLAYTQTEGARVSSVVLGIGMNVETKPQVEPTRFVPEVACLQDLVRDKKSCRQKNLFDGLVIHLARNYRLLKTGQFSKIMDLYREYSCVIGRKVEIYPDAQDKSAGNIISGVVTGIGDNLEIYLRGLADPVNKGRLALKSAE